MKALKPTITLENAEKYLKEGLKNWKKAGAKVTFLENKVPKAELGLKDNPIILLISGIHLEETSGYKVLLEPKYLLPLLKKYNYLFQIFPLINQHGLKLSPNTESPEHRELRYNEKDINYNSGWGLSNSNEKTQEGLLVENDILETLKKKKIAAVITLHEDSTTPGKGYIYANNIPKKVRNNIASQLKKSVSNNILYDNQIQPPISIEGEQGFIENEFMFVDYNDIDSIESWLAGLGIPVILSEGPFGLDEKTQKDFQLKLIQTVLENF